MDVGAIQRALQARGYDLGPAGVDGDAGPRTIAAVTAFQHAAGMVPDGVPGRLTQLLLAEPVPAARGKAKARKAATTPAIPLLRAPVAVPGWLVLANAMLGTREGAGAVNNPDVVKLFADAGFPGIKTDSTAWCAAFGNGMLKRSGHRGSCSLAARSFETWGVGLREPVLGCIGVKRRAGKNAPAWQGHVGFVVAANATTVWLLGGNQNDAVSIAAFPRSEFTAFRWPLDVPLPPLGASLPTTIAGAKAAASEA